MTDQPDEHATRADVLFTAKDLVRRGLVEGTSGNVSARLDPERVCMTPSSLSYETMTVDDLCIVDLDGNVLDGERGPTSEKDLHLACYRSYPELNGVIHCHAVYATMFAVTRQMVQAAVEEVTIYLGGDIPCADYRVTGSAELGDEVARHLKDRSAVLVASHGIVTVGTTLDRALHNAALVERTAKIVWGARQIGTVAEIPPEVNERFAGYYPFMR